MSFSSVIFTKLFKLYFNQNYFRCKHVVESKCIKLVIFGFYKKLQIRLKKTTYFSDGIVWLNFVEVHHLTKSKKPYIDNRRKNKINCLKISKYRLQDETTKTDFDSVGLIWKNILLNKRTSSIFWSKLILLMPLQLTITDISNSCFTHEILIILDISGLPEELVGFKRLNKG